MQLWFYEEFLAGCFDVLLFLVTIILLFPRPRWEISGWDHRRHPSAMLDRDGPKTFSSIFRGTRRFKANENGGRGDHRFEISSCIA